jgi:hypothetical protein
MASSQLRSAYFDDFDGGPKVLIWGDASGLRSLMEVLRTTSNSKIAFSGFCQCVDGREIILERTSESLGMRSTNSGFGWGVSANDLADFVDKVDALVSSNRSGHQYLECGSHDSITVIVSLGEYPEDLRP